MTFITQMKQIIGEAYVISEQGAMQAYLQEWNQRWQGRAALVLRPKNTEEIMQIMALAFATRTAIVPQSGNTGLVGGQIPDESGKQVVLSLDRMTSILEVDPYGNTITVEAGCLLKSVKQAAADVNRLFPLSLASKGSCRIGGNLSTNAGGLDVLAYGNARNLCLGLEVVLADGRLWSGLRHLRKDNTGYDLKNLFVGAEGTLGIITKAVLKLFARPNSLKTLLLAVSDPHKAVEILNVAQEISGNRLIACELMPRLGVEFTIRHMRQSDPFRSAAPWYVLCEFADVGEDFDRLFLEKITQCQLVCDCLMAQSERQRQDLWSIRETMPDSQHYEGASIKHDIAVPIQFLADFIAEVSRVIVKHMPGARLMVFGHLGDGSLHFNISQPIDLTKEEFFACEASINDIVFGAVLNYGGTISAEHGIGQLRRERLGQVKAGVELAMMQAIKQLFDPHNILNPGKLLP